MAYRILLLLFCVDILLLRLACKKCIGPWAGTRVTYTHHFESLLVCTGEICPFFRVVKLVTLGISYDPSLKLNNQLFPADSLPQDIQSRLKALQPAFNNPRRLGHHLTRLEPPAE